jgi:anti-sigma regulatory factor (Ser/Thr protein kinase)
MARRPRPEIREFILENVEAHPDSVVSMAGEKFGLSRAAIGAYVSRLLADGLITAEGKTRGRRYALAFLVNDKFRLERNGLWTEDNVWRERILPLMKNIKQNIVDICHYGCTEMVNNVLDHSMSPDIMVGYQQTHTKITIHIIDNGVGIFNKIQQDFHLADARTALLELSKGKLTSDKKRHSGVGIYFTSRMFDKFSILSGHLCYTRIRRDGDDWLVETSDEEDDQKGTAVRMIISTNADWTTRGVFEKYQGDDIYFRKTHVPVSLGRYPGEQLVSRSQAKRILARFADFSEVILDFDGVAEIGQPFADEIFRVFKNEHPNTPIYVARANEAVNRMIRYVESENATLPLPFSGTKPSETA